MKREFLKRVSALFPLKSTRSRKAEGVKRQLYGFAHSQPAWLATESLEDRTLLAAAFPEFIDPHPASGNQFGSQVVPLSTGNVVITSPYDDAGGSDAGAVYLFNGATGALISTLTGSTANDRIGNVVALANGNFVVRSYGWDNGSALDAGAVTWGSGITGIAGVVSSLNSLVGSSTNDHVGEDGITVLSNGNYVVNSRSWDNGVATNAGAVTWGSGDSGVKGAISAANSLIGDATNDEVGLGGVTILANGNYIVVSRYWSNGSALRAGAVTWSSGTNGVKGVVSASNSLVGNKFADVVGYSNDGLDSVVALPNGNYVVRSPLWNNGTLENAGAVTWGNGLTGVKGVVSSSNSLVGSAADDLVGATGLGVTVLSNGNYVVRAEDWNNGTLEDAGAVTWADGAVGVKGVISASNSLIGDAAFDHVGGLGVTPLANGNYVVSSPEWSNGSIARAGAVTWGSGASGIKGVVSPSNSLVGDATDDRIGRDGVFSLSSGHFVVASANWSNGAATSAGAVTWGNGSTGLIGIVSASNSLVGTKINDGVGGEITEVGSGNYVVQSPYWDNGATIDAGAVTWGSGISGIKGAVSASNSLVGSSANDQIALGSPYNPGYGSVTVLSNGNYVVVSHLWDNGAATDAGAVTWGNGNSGVTGVVSASNSLVGSTANDQVGWGSVTSLSNGNYVVLSQRWDNGAATNAGAVTWGSGINGVTGVVSSSNSLVGSTANSQASGSITTLGNGNYLWCNYYWDNGDITDAGAVTWGNGTIGASGVVNASNSLIGSSANNLVGIGGVTLLSNGNYVVRSYYWDNGVATDAGAVTWGSGSSGVSGIVSPSNSLVGTTVNSRVGFGTWFYAVGPYWGYDGVNALSNGNYVVVSPYWDNGSATAAGSITFGNGTLGVKGVVSASNSAIGEVSESGMSSTAVPDQINEHFYAQFLNEHSGVVRVGSQVDGFPKMAITMDSGNLVIDAREGDNNLTVSVVGSDLVIADPLELFGTAPVGGTLSNNNHTLTIPLSSITGSITINGGGGDDTLTVDLSGGDPISNGGLIFNGNDPTVGPGDTLKIVGGNQGTVTYNYTNAHDGSVVLSNYGTISYTGLEPIVNSGTATDVVFNLPAGTNDVTLSDDGTIGNNLSRLLGLGLETTYFANPTGSLEIRRGSANDKLFVNAIPDLTSSLRFGSNANPFQSIEFDGAVSLAATKSLTAHAQSIITQAPLTTSAGDVALYAANGITLNDAIVTGGGALTLNADSDANGTGSVSVATPVFGNWLAPATESFLSSTSSSAGDTAGSAVAISKDGNTAIVGAALDDVGLNTDQGSAIVYIRSGGVWIEQATLTSLTGAADDRFGTSVALSSDGNTAVIGAYLDDIGANGNEGSVTVFVRVAGVWTEQALLTASDGEASDTFGISVDVSNDGNTLVVGAYLDNVGSAGNAGSVTVFTRTGSTWTQQAKVVAADGEVDDRLGFSVAVSGDGNSLIGGAYLDDIGTATRRGSAYVFTKSGVTWTQQMQLVAGDGLAQDRFGTSVDLSVDGATAIVGAHLADVGANADQGAAYTYSRLGTTWSQRAKLTAADGAATDYFGYWTSISGVGNTALVGSRLDDVGANVDQGSATIFTRNGISWTQRNQLFGTGGSAGGNFGIVAALDGDGSTAILGAYINNIGASIDQGSASIFDRAVNTAGGSLHSAAGTMNLSGVSADIQGSITSTGGSININTTNGITLRSDLESGGGNVTLNADFDANGTGTATLTTAALGLFTQQQQITDSTGGAGDTFGRAVAISDDGSTAIVGSYCDDVGANVDQGSAKAFIRSGDVWIEQQQLFATGGAAGDRFGFSVALSSDGNTAIVGAYFDTVGANVEQGSAIVFKRTAGIWSQQQQLTATASAVSTVGAAGDRFGYSVALSSDGNMAIVGAYTDDVGSNSNQGSAIVFSRAGTTWSPQKQLTATGGAASDNFGISVALSSNGNTAIIGVYADDVGSNTNQGSAVIFTRSGTVWSQQQQIFAADGAGSDLFGLSVALSDDGSTAIVGAYRDDMGFNVDQGSATFFTRSGSVWTQQQQVFANDGEGDNFFGYSVDLSTDGNTAIIGTVFDDVGGNANQGSVTVYTRTGGVWTPQQQFIKSGGAAGDEFSSDVSLSGDGLTLIIGADLDDVGANADQGSSLIFTRTAGSIMSGAGNVSMTTHDVDIQGPIKTASEFSIVSSQTNRQLNLGTDVMNSLSLTEAELDQIVGQTLVIGDTAGGEILVSSSITRQFSTNMSLFSGSNIILSPGSINTNGGSLQITPGIGSSFQPIAYGLDFATSASAAITFSPGTDLEISINGTTADTQLRQLNVEGGVNISGVDLVLSGSYIPMTTDSFVIVNNDSTDPVIGTFNGMPEGTIVSVNGSDKRLSYVSGTGNDVVLLDSIPPEVLGTTPNFSSSGTLATGATSLKIYFSEPVIGANLSTNYELRRAGDDGLLGNADDPLITITSTTFASGTNTATLNFDGLVEDVYQLTVKDSITDSFGNPLDGDGIGSADGNWKKDFVVGAVSTTLTSPAPNSYPFEIEFGGFGAGQLVQGPDGAFDGLNRLQVGGVMYSPTTPSIPAADISRSSASPSFTASSSYTAIPGLTTTFTSDGSQPIELATDLSFFLNSGATYYQLAARFVVDGVPRPDRYLLAETLNASGTNLRRGYMEEVLSLAAGSHTVSVQVSTYGAPGQVVMFNTYVQSISATEFNTLSSIPAANVSRSSASPSFTATSSYTAIPGLTTTFTSDGSQPIELATDLSYFLNPGPTFYQLAARFVVDGVPGPDRFILAETLNASGTNLRRGYMEEVLSLAAGSHTVSVQVSTFGASGQVVMFNTYAQSISATEFNTLSSIPAANVSRSSASPSFTATSSYTAIPGLTTTFTSDGSQPIELATDLSYFLNPGPTFYQLAARFVVDGVPGPDRFILAETLNASGTNLRRGYMEEVLSLAAGSHTVSVQVSTFGASGQVVMFNTYAQSISATEFNQIPVPELNDGDRTVVTNSQSLSGLTVSREVTVPNSASQDFARTVDVFTNSTASPITTNSKIVGNLGSDANTTVFATSDGDLNVEPTDWWFGTDDADGTGTPAIIHLIHGPLGLAPTSVNVLEDNVEWTYDLTVNAGETKRLASFTVLGTTRAQAIASANTMVTNTGFGGPAAAFLTPTEIASLANFEPNIAPTNLSISTTSVPENRPSGTQVGVFSSVDTNRNDAFTYSLVSGSGDEGNARFQIVGNILQTAAELDYEAQSQFSVRIRTTDIGGLFFDRVLSISVLNALDGTSGSDAFVLTYSASAVAITMAINGGVPISQGTFPLTTPLTIPGLTSSDSVRVVGTSGNDTFNITGGGYLINGASLSLEGPAGRTFTGGAGNDTYQFDADSGLGIIALDESGGGTDTLDFSTSTVGITLNLGTIATQVTHSNLSLRLSSTTTFENAIGGLGNDTISGNTLANILTGNAGNDKLTGNAGNDSLLGGLGDDTYLFGLASAAEADTVSEASNAGSDTLSFSTLTTAVILNLGTTAIQSVHANRTLKLNGISTFENSIGGSSNDTMAGNALANILTGNNGNDILVGNAGDDTLSGGNGRDILIGGLGVDTVLGGNDDDILISGRTTSDTLFTKLNDLRTEWVSINSYASRIAKLRAGVGASTASLKAKVTVLNDFPAIDTLSGGGGTDWYFRAVDDVITDLLAAESVDVL